MPAKCLDDLGDLLSRPLGGDHHVLEADGPPLSKRQQHLPELMLAFAQTP